MHRWIRAPLLVALLSGCSLSLGAGAKGSVGRQRSGRIGPNCVGFESCERIYRDVALRSDRCHANGADCEAEDRDAALSYGILVEQTHRELEAARLIAQQAEQQIAAVHIQERADCARRLVEPAPSPSSK